MPYYHKHCGGKISILRRRCSKCGKKWPISAWFKYPPPRDMTPYIIERKETSYAKWADKVPYGSTIPKALPNWPRWARILTTIVVIGIIIFLIRGCF